MDNEVVDALTDLIEIIKLDTYSRGRCSDDETRRMMAKKFDDFERNFLGVIK